MKNRFRYMNETGMSLTILKNLKKCPDCGGEMVRVTCVNPEHFIYSCFECHAMFKDKSAKTSWKCREW